MIPKRIFYLWCGSSKPIDVEVCVQTWRQAMPDYEIVELNENDTTYFNFQKELKENDWFRALYERKLWAFISDYVRAKVVYDHGGIWLDTDVTAVKPLDPFLNEKVFLGRENDNHLESAVFGGEKGHPFVKKVVDFYDDEVWHSKLYTLPRIFTYFLAKDYGFVPGSKGILKTKDVTVYPPEYFFPLPLNKNFTPECLTPDSYTIHWWKSSWSRPEVTNWLKNKHVLGKEKSMRVKLTAYRRIFLFGFLKIGRYEYENGVIRLFGLPFINIKKLTRKTTAYLLKFLPLIKLK